MATSAKSLPHGYTTTRKPPTRAEQAAFDRQRAETARISSMFNPEVRRRQIAEREAAAEAERAAAWPDPQAQLQVAHDELAKAETLLRERQAALARGEGRLEDARADVSRIERHRTRATTAAARALQHSIEQNKPAPKSSKPLPEIAEAQSRLDVAEAAILRLTEGRTDADQAVAAAHAAVRRSAFAVLTAQAVELAERILELDAETQRLRDELAAFTLLGDISAADGRWHAIPTPSIVGKAIAPVDSILHRVPGQPSQSPSWADRLQKLCDGRE